MSDFGLGTSDFLTNLCSQLHGQKTCIRGNHDGSPAKMHKIGFSLVLESAFIKIGRHEVELIHIPKLPAPSHFQLHGHVHEKRPNKLIDRQLNLYEFTNPATKHALADLIDLYVERVLPGKPRIDK